MLWRGRKATSFSLYVSFTGDKGNGFCGRHIVTGAVRLPTAAVAPRKTTRSLAARRVTAAMAVQPEAGSLRYSIRSLDADHWLQGTAAGVRGSALTRRLEIATRATHGRVRPSTRRGPLDVSASRAVASLVAPRAYPEGKRKRERETSRS